MLLTVIPFSKLILAVLVKTVAPNKPEGNKWSTTIAGLLIAKSAIERIAGISGKPSGGAGGGFRGGATGLPRRR